LRQKFLVLFHEEEEEHLMKIELQHEYNLYLANNLTPQSDGVDTEKQVLTNSS
jgi:hypothetical protein